MLITEKNLYIIKEYLSCQPEYLTSRKNVFVLLNEVHKLLTFSLAFSTNTNQENPSNTQTKLHQKLRVDLLFTYLEQSSLFESMQSNNTV